MWVTTLSNGRTYGILKRTNNTWEIVEFGQNNQLRFTGVFKDGPNILCSDGSLQSYTELNNIFTYKRSPLTGFDGSGNPQWSSTTEVLGVSTLNSVTGSPATLPNSQIFSTTTNKMALFQPGITANRTGPVYTTGYHLGIMSKGANNTFLAQTEKSTHRTYQGDYPKAGWFDAGNMVNDYAGSTVNIVDRNIITGYHGEFWKNMQTNQYNHYYDNGLAIGQFGTNRNVVGLNTLAAAGMAGNALTPMVVKDSNGDLYLWHGDESDHAGVHRWKISGLNSIAEQVIAIAYPSAYSPTGNFTDLMAGLPLSATLINNTAGWTRTPTGESTNWSANTTVLTYDKLNSNDLRILFSEAAASTNTISRDLGTNNVTSDWKISGSVAWGGHANYNANTFYQYLEVLDDAGKVLTSFYPQAEYNTGITIWGNTVSIKKTTFDTRDSVVKKLRPFEISLSGGKVSFTYDNGLPVITTISDATGNWRTPKTLRARFLNIGGWGANYGVEIDLSDLKFYKDNNAASVLPATIKLFFSMASNKFTLVAATIRTLVFWT